MKINGYAAIGDNAIAKYFCDQRINEPTLVRDNKKRL